MAWALTVAADALWFGLRSVEVPAAMIGYATVALLAALVTTAIVGWRSTRAPINEQLRDVPPAPARRGFGVLEVVFGTAAAVGLGLALTSTSAGGLTLLTPMLLAAFGRAGARPARGRGREPGGPRGLAAPATGRGPGRPNVARRRGYRLAITVLAVAVGLIVLAGQQGQVAAQNRAARALAENGAAVVLTSTPRMSPRCWPGCGPVIRRAATPPPSSSRRR